LSQARSAKISDARAAEKRLSSGRSGRKCGFFARQSLSFRMRWNSRRNSEHAALGTATNSSLCASSTYAKCDVYATSRRVSAATRGTAGGGGSENAMATRVRLAISASIAAFSAALSGTRFGLA